MKDILLRISRVALSFLILTVLVSGCNQSSQSSQYPANLSGRVTISQKIKAPNVPVAVSSDPTSVFWIVQVSIKNIRYSNPITDRSAARSWSNDWQIVASSAGSNVPWQFEPYPDFSPDSFNIASGQTAQLTMVFIVERDITVKNAQICYVGQEPNSFGKLTQAGSIEAYDWATKTAIAFTPPPTTAPTTETYLVHGASTLSSFSYMQLKTIANWQGTTSKTLSFTATRVPCVINYGWTVTSSINSDVTVQALTRTTNVLQFGEPTEYGLQK